jgi:hypothetical protein
VLLTAGCRSADLFAGPDPLGRRPPLAHDTVVLQSVIAAEQVLISRYKSAVSAGPRPLLATLLAAVLAQHQQHLVQLKARLIVPPGARATASPTPAAGGTAMAPHSTGPHSTAPHSTAPHSTAPHSAGQLREAELGSAASLTGHLVSVEASLAQLFASIAASDATHAAALGGS